jgi:hypothetical protein
MQKNYLFIFFALLFFAVDCNSQNKTGKKINNLPADSTEEQQTKSHKPANKIGKISVPQGYERAVAPKNSIASYLRNLDLKTDDNTVYLYNGKAKGIQSSQYAVLKIDVGKRDLQQCADAAMRLRGEYLYTQKKFSDIHFNFLSDGKPRYYTDYAKGDYAYKKFRKYMDYIFAYANTASLKRELLPVNNPHDIQAGDIFIQTGNPYGHAVTVMDVAKNESTNETLFLLSQSYMPAQDIHILVNPVNNSLSPWYKVKPDTQLQTPEWTFYWSDLMRFPE